MPLTRNIEHQCPVCEVVHSIYHVHCDKKMVPLTVLELCDYHKALKEDGAVFIIEIEEPDPLRSVDLHTAVRTGKFIVIEKMLADGLYEAEADPDEYGILLVDEDTFHSIHTTLKTLPGLDEKDEH